MLLICILVSVVKYQGCYNLVIFFCVGDSKHSSFLKYIEVAENMICIEKQERPAVPKALSVQEYYSKKDLM